MKNSDPRVNGGGFARLKDAGIMLSVGLCAREAALVMSGFRHRVRTGQPELCILAGPAYAIPDGVDSLLVTVDGRVAVRTRTQQDLTVPDSDYPITGDLLTVLGGMGLTSVAVPARDPIAAILRRDTAALAPSDRI
ncbi:hypothetical protein JMM63_10995 [Rhodovulum sulfidophilum]|uniref:hypothetical protein n=1 Tax=Rhodovulum sulfidophilum TaxID=35806 RepID=UPI001920D31A|nr:hypothetical protein [Rhodovulum sulfidophilum]MBL3596090.1 hypothetical protein [Rhodovulum sulfidophilum]